MTDFATMFDQFKWMTTGSIVSVQFKEFGQRYGWEILCHFENFDEIWTISYFFQESTDLVYLGVPCMCNCWLLSLAYYRIVTYTLTKCHGVPCSPPSRITTKVLKNCTTFSSRPRPRPTPTPWCIVKPLIENKAENVTRLNQSQSDQLSPADYTYPFVIIININVGVIIISAFLCSAICNLYYEMAASMSLYSLWTHNSWTEAHTKFKLDGM